MVYLAETPKSEFDLLNARLTARGWPRRAFKNALVARLDETHFLSEPPETLGRPTCLPRRERTMTPTASAPSPESFDFVQFIRDLGSSVATLLGIGYLSGFMVYHA